jgi:hypothetical protein
MTERRRILAKKMAFVRSVIDDRHEPSVLSTFLDGTSVVVVWHARCTPPRG